MWVWEQKEKRGVKGRGAPLTHLSAISHPAPIPHHYQISVRYQPKRKKDRWKQSILKAPNMNIPVLGSIGCMCLFPNSALTLIHVQFLTCSEQTYQQSFCTNAAQKNITVPAGSHDHKYSMIINNPHADGLSLGRGHKHKQLLGQKMSETDH